MSVVVKKTWTFVGLHGSLIWWGTCHGAVKHSWNPIRPLNEKCSQPKKKHKCGTYEHSHLLLCLWRWGQEVRESTSNKLIRVNCARNGAQSALGGIQSTDRALVLVLRIFDYFSVGGGGGLPWREWCEDTKRAAKISSQETDGPTGWKFCFWTVDNFAKKGVVATVFVGSKGLCQEPFSDLWKA